MLAQQKIEEAEATLRGATELARLGTWELNVATGNVTYSDRIKWQWAELCGANAGGIRMNGYADQGSAYVFAYRNPPGYKKSRITPQCV